MTSAAAAGCGSLLLTVRGSSPTSTQLIRIETEQEADAADRPTGLSVPVQSSATAGEIDLRRGERACRPARRAVRPGRTMQPPPPPPVAYLGRYGPFPFTGQVALRSIVAAVGGVKRVRDVGGVAYCCDCT